MMQAELSQFLPFNALSFFHLRFYFAPKNQLTFNFSIMNANNPYRLPERPQNPNLIEKSSPPIQRSDHQDIRGIRSQQKNGNTPQALITVANMLKKTSLSPLSKEQGQTMKAPPLPHSRQSSKNTSLNQRNIVSPMSYRSSPHTSLKESRGNYSINLNNEGKDSGVTSLRDTFGLNNFEIKGIHERLEVLTKEIKDHDKRLRIVENKSDQNTSPNSVADKSDISVKSFIEKTLSSKLEETNHVISSIQSEIKLCMKETDKMNIQNDIFDKLKIKSQFSESSGELSKDYSFNDQLEEMKKHLQIKINKNLDLVTNVVSRLQKKVNSIDERSFKKSPLQSQKTPVILKYIEQFRIGEEKLQVTNHSFYIDNEGYLMDKDMYYLVDSNGKQVRLEEKHLKMMKLYHLL